MRAKLFCRTGGLAGADHQIGGEATIGRSAVNTVVLGAPVISQSHARIFFDDAAGAYILEDLQSRNGTRLDGIRVHGRERLRDLHVITLGEEHDFIFVALPETAAGPPVLTDAPAAMGEGATSGEERTVYESPAALKLPALTDAPAGKDEGAPPGGVATVYEAPTALELPALTDAPAGKDEGAPPGGVATVYEAPTALELPPLEAGPQGPVDPEAPTVVQSAPVPVAARAVLEVTATDGSRFRVELAEGRHYIGRARECAVWIDEGTLTLRHAVLTVAGDTVTIEDEGSLNGTFMDGVRLTEPVRLRVGDLVTLAAQVTARLVDP